MILQKLIKLLIKTYYFIKTHKFINKKTHYFIEMINSFHKTDDFIKMINSLSKTDDFIRNDKFS